MKNDSAVPFSRKNEKQESRDNDQKLLISGQMTASEINKKNSFFAVLNTSKFKLISIRGRRFNSEDIS